MAGNRERAGGTACGCGRMTQVLPHQAQELVTRYLDTADSVCPGMIGALYLVGSVALGDFQPSVSDVDFMAVTARQPDAAGREALAAVHEQVRGNGQQPVFEGPYVTFDELRASPSAAAEGPFHGDQGLGWGPNMRTPVAWVMLARHGIPVRGPEPAALGIFTSPEELRTWTLGNLGSYWAVWLERSRDHSSQAAQAMLTDWGVAWGVLGVSRLHYTLATGQITSKTGAGQYGLDTFAARWHPIITEALRCRPRPLARPDSLEDAQPRREEATAFVDFAISAARGLA